ncbi:MAG: MBL fold metallo-hydrolase [Actinobacteria bacterium]|jgi:glyoxylase-like metal-dependent hydrolase (beta-lactamase superfamily II)/rhodanese-related sulfurtransferase|nr:MBL fold metallo-hydrolase [Actinomycetota bacterium]
MQILTIETPSLGDRSYIVSDGSVAAVIDPQRDIDRVLDLLEQHGLTVTHVLETHNHNDYVTGGVELARVTGAAYVMNADEDLLFEVQGIRDGEELTVGKLTIRALHTPGHTPTHMSYLVTDGVQEAVFTGGSLLYGSVGRTDLISKAATEELTRAQYASARRLVAELDGETTVLPTHGFGSFCSSAAADDQSASVDPKYGVETSTIADQQQANVALTITDEDEFVRLLISGLDAYPRYYAHMGGRNKVGPAGVDLSPATEADPTELARRMHSGEWVVDLRTRTAYAKDHVRGTLNVEVGNSFITYLAWIIPWGTPVTLIGDTQDEVDEAQRQMVRVGIDRPAAQATGGVDAFGAGLDRGSYKTAKFDELAELLQQDAPIHVLDVRRNGEREDGGLAGSFHIPLHELVTRVDELPTEGEIWVHCQSGYRASIATSIIARSGRVPVLVDDDASRMAELDLQLEAA